METKRRVLKKIIKRDGREVPYDNHKIAKAIGMAYSSVYGNLDKFGEDIGNLLRDIDNNIDWMEFDEMGVEDIQDVVVSWLYAYDKEVGNAYYDYREERSRIREQNTTTFKKIMSIMKAENVVNSNANVDENSFGGKKFEASGSLFKKIALDVLLPKEISKAHKENRGYVHDLDSYAVGMHNCIFTDTKKLLTEGFGTRNGDVRSANSIMTAMQLIAVIFQIQSQEQFGGVASMHLDYDLEEFVDKSFRKYIQEGYHFLEEVETKINNRITLEDENTYKYVPDKVKNYAFEKLEKEGIQASQSLFHNLNTLESRPGSQVPFSSINFGRRESVRAKMICKWLLKASLDGIGKFHRTSIFPISIFQYKQGINDVEGTPNYDIKKLAIESMCKRIYPNWVNGDWSKNVEDPNNPDTAMATINKPVA